MAALAVFARMFLSYTTWRRMQLSRDGEKPLCKLQSRQKTTYLVYLLALMTCLWLVPEKT
jgi:hypothetical protein